MSKFLASLFNRGKLVKEEERVSTISSVTYRWVCNICSGIIEEGTIRYKNLNSKSDDYCEKCFNQCLKNIKKLPSNEWNEWEQVIHGDFDFIVTASGHYHQSKDAIKCDRVNRIMYRAFVEFSLYPCFGVLENSQYHWYKYEQIFHMVCALAMGLEHFLDVQPLVAGSTEPRVFVSICGKNNLYWFLSDYACLFKGIVTVPIHYAQTVQEIDDITTMTETKAMICTEEMLESFIQVAKCKDFVKYIFVMDGTTPSTSVKNGAGTTTIEILPLSQVMDIGNDKLCEILIKTNQAKKDRYPSYFVNHETILQTNPKYNKHASKLWIDRGHESILLNILPDEKDLLTLIFTSGSTGKPKGIMVPDSSILKDLVGFTSENPKVIFSFCPLAHMTDRKHTMLSLTNSARVAIFSRDFEHIFEEIQLCRPTIMVSTPRLYNVIFDEFKKTVELEKSKRIMENKPIDMKEIEQFVLTDFKKILGGRVQSIVIGGASSSEAVRDFLSRCFNCIVSDGYGQSEAGGIMSDNRLHTNVEYKLVDVPEMNYFSTDKPFPRGELCVKTKTMFTGYFKNEELTKETLDEEGWLHTSDIVEELGFRTIRIIDRKKNIFKLAQGEFISPAKIEDILMTSPFIFQDFIYGNVQRSYLVGIIIPNVKVLKNFALTESIFTPKDDSNEFTEDEKAIIKINPKIKQKYVEEIESVAKLNGLLPYEVPKDFLFDFEPFSEANNRITSSMKVKRFDCEMHYKEVLEQLYEKLESDKNVSLKEQVANMLLSSLGITMDESEDNGSSKVIDSLHAVKFAGIVKKKFNMDIPISLLFSQTDQSSDSVVTRVTNFLLKQENKTETVDWLKEILLPEDLVRELMNITSKGKFDNVETSKRSVLLTGSSGFLGSFILRDLLERIKDLPTNVQVYCIVRTKSEGNQEELANHEEGHRRIKNKLVDFKLWKDSYATRIVALSGDLEKSNLGLSEVVFEQLSQHVGSIYHNGAYVNSVMSYSQLYATNAGSTLEMVKLAVKSSKHSIESGQSLLCPLTLISTIGVLQSGLSQYGFPIDSPPVVNYHFLKQLAEQTVPNLRSTIESANGYSSSKFVAEQYVQQARLLGYPCAIFRPGMIGSDTENGIANTVDWVNRLVLGCFLMRCYPVTGRNLNLTPVDIISKIITNFTQHKYAFLETTKDGSKYQIYELANSEAYEIKIDDLLSVAATVDATNKEPMELLSYREWKKQLLELTANKEQADNSLLALLTLFKSDYNFPSSGDSLKRSHINKIIQALSQTNDPSCCELLPVKNLDKVYMEKCVKFLLNPPSPNHE